MKEPTRIDERFSSAEFEKLGLDTEAAAALAVLLKQEIHEELHELILPAFEKIISKLNSMGHQLRPYGPPSPGDIGYRDESAEGDKYKCKLRVAIDTTISTGYAHLTILEDIGDSE